MYLKKLKIGNVELENNILLAPMAGITDLAFRKICKEYGGPGLVYTEMASSRAIFHNDEKTKKLLDVEGEKRPIAVQIFGSDTEAMKAYIESEDMKTYADAVVSTEEMEIAGKEGLYVQAIDTVTATIMADGNKDFYMIPSEGGFYFISFTFDPYGKVDYSNAYAHIVDSITIG